MQSLPSTLSLPANLEGGKNHKSAETRQGPKMFLKFTPD
jgi:hypothetical protein